MAKLRNTSAMPFILDARPWTKLGLFKVDMDHPAQDAWLLWDTPKAVDLCFSFDGPPPSYFWHDAKQESACLLWP